MTCFRMTCLLLIPLILATENAVSQLLPPQANVVTDTRRRIGGNEGNARLREAVDALRQGDFRSVSAKLAGDSFVVSPDDIPGLSMEEVAFYNALVTFASESNSSNDCASSPSLTRDTLKDLSSARNVSLYSQTLNDGDVEFLTALLFLKKQIAPLALDHAQLAHEEFSQQPRAAFLRLVNDLKSLGCGDRNEHVWKMREGYVHTWRSAVPATHPVSCFTMTDSRDQFVGTVLVERNEGEPGPDRRYQIVFRDLDAPPLLLFESGPEVPAYSSLVSFTQEFLATESRDKSRFTRLRCAMEALYAVQAELTPLAAAWCQQALDSDSLLTEQVEKPLRDRNAWNWELRFRHGAGELNGLRVLAEMPSSGGDSQATRFVFEYGPAGAPTWEVLGYVNRDAERIHSTGDAPERLEHFHFAVGTGDERLHVASFRLVSDRVGSRDRLYSVQYLTRNELITLDVMSEQPSFEEFRNQVLDWVNAWPRQSRLETSIAERWQPLFNGKDLDGWKVTQFGGEGKVFVENGEVVISQGVDLSGIHTEKEIPRSDYEIQFEAQRAAGDDIFAGLTFPVKDSHCSLIIGGWGGGVCGISSLDGMDASENETTSFQQFEEGKWYRIRIVVRDNHLAAWLDDKQIVDVDTTGKQIGVRFDMERSKPFGFSTYATTGHFRNVRIRTLPPEESK